MEHQQRKAWATARHAREELGISERTLARWRGSGLLKPGKHWRRKFPTPNSPVLYHLPSCEEAMGEATARSADLLERAVVPTRPHRHRSPCLRSLKMKQAGRVINAKRQMPAKAKSLVGLLATWALLLFVGDLFPSPVQAFEAKDLERVLKGGDCPGCDLSGADLFTRNLANINLSGANLSRAKLSFANLKSGNLSRADLSDAELAFSFLFETNLTQANLSQANLNGAYLHKANLEGAILAGADLSRGHLFDANLKGADLKKATMEETNLSGANLERSNLDQASFSETIYDATTRFPSGFKIIPSAFTIVQPKTETYDPPDRTNARLAEIH